jgi:hypothetical protein
LVPVKKTTQFAPEKFKPIDFSPSFDLSAKKSLCGMSSMTCYWVIEKWKSRFCAALQSRFIHQHRISFFFDFQHHCLSLNINIVFLCCDFRFQHLRFLFPISFSISLANSWTSCFSNFDTSCFTISKQLQQWFEETSIVLVITLSNSSSKIKRLQVSPLYNNGEKKITNFIQQ